LTTTRARHARHEVAALDLHGERLVEGVGVAHLALHPLGGLLAHQQVVLTLHVRDDGLVHLVAAHADGLRVHDAREGDDRHLGGAAADVDHHVARGLGDGQARPDGRGHGLLDEVHLAGAGALGALAHGALLHLGDAEGHADDDAGLHQRAAVVHLADEVPEHGAR
jgi:hypothetical protein